MSPCRHRLSVEDAAKMESSQGEHQLRAAGGGILASSRETIHQEKECRGQRPSQLGGVEIKKQTNKRPAVGIWGFIVRACGD